MSAAAYRPDQDVLTHDSTQDRRRTKNDAPPGQHRRINDRWFNKARWEIAIGLWLVAGLAVLAYLIQALVA